MQCQPLLLSVPSTEHCQLSPCCGPAHGRCLQSVRVGLSYKPAPAERGELLALPRALELLLHVQVLEELRCPAWAQAAASPCPAARAGPWHPGMGSFVLLQQPVPGEGRNFLAFLALLSG